MMIFQHPYPQCTKLQKHRKMCGVGSSKSYIMLFLGTLSLVGRGLGGATPPPPPKKKKKKKKREREREREREKGRKEKRRGSKGEGKKSKLWDWSLILGKGGGGGLKNGKIAGPKLFALPLKTVVLRPPFKGWKHFAPPPSVWLKHQASTEKLYTKTFSAPPSALWLKYFLSPFS